MAKRKARRSQQTTHVGERIPLTADELQWAKDYHAGKINLEHDPTPITRGSAKEAEIKPAQASNTRPGAPELSEQETQFLAECDKGWNQPEDEPIQTADLKVDYSTLLMFDSDFPDRLAEEYPHLSIIQKLLLVGELQEFPPKPPAFPASSAAMRKYLANCKAVKQIYADAIRRRPGKPTSSETKQLARFIDKRIAAGDSLTIASEAAWKFKYPHLPLPLAPTNRKWWLSYTKTIYVRWKRKAG